MNVPMAVGINAIADTGLSAATVDNGVKALSIQGRIDKRIEFHLGIRKGIYSMREGS